ncbi:MAG: 16S rRNA (cytidine(1402)-2'-O)-methyltransferase [Clostridia bacterium]|nr:16S rRNA (cytidine(1402)-2'-O)-methyltransferase [Clostridia bacterium]
MENRKLIELINENMRSGADVAADLSPLAPKLYLCATPIGNLGDITLRTLETLSGADKIYCEDTRSTLKLLNAYGIKKPLESCHEHNEKSRAERIAQEVRRGEAVAFVSDAGLPGVSDPGAELIKRFVELGLPFEVQPGASALTTAWIMSGLDTKSLLFLGFLPRSGAERTAALERIAKSGDTLIVYESPLRVGTTLRDIAEAIENAGQSAEKRPCALVREITKAFEECVRGSVRELAERYASVPPKGECVLVIGKADDDSAPESNAKLDALLTGLLSEGISVKSASRIAAETLDLPKNAAYKRAMELINTK